MPPSSHRRPRTRRLGSTPDDHELPDSSPSRPRTKRRKVVDTVDTVTPEQSAQDQLNTVIANLAMPDGPVTVAKVCANEINFQENTGGVTAYAKIAGASWTFYVKDLVIRIGRPPDNRPSTAGSPTPPPQSQKEDQVHIDLGPSKLVSRSHAVMFYDTEAEYNWKLQVIGRNGVKVDDELYKKDAKVVLRSGSVIEIAGVQMMFVLPDKEPEVAPSILRRTQLNQFAIDEDLQLHTTQDNDSLPFEAPPYTSSQSTKPGSQLEPTQSTVAAASLSQPEPQARAPSSVTQPAYHRGLMLESTEDVDYADESMKEVKPPYSYAMLIAQAILSVEEECLTLASIYQFIQDKYAFYRHSQSGWQNSIRHNLSLNKAFQKIPRRSDEPGKGMKWQLLPDHREDYIKKLRKQTKEKGTRQSSSQPGSPSSPKARLSQPQPPPAIGLAPGASLKPDDTQDINASFTPTKNMSRSVTPPPIAAYRVQPLEAYTPDRGSRLPALRNNDRTLVDTPRPTPGRPSSMSLRSGDMTSQTQVASSVHGDSTSAIHPSPSQPSAYGDDNPAVSTVTPAPQRQHPRLAPPSTSQLPSSYLPTSSPAPFWKYVQFGSTPAKPADYSPLKDLHSSSPPPVGEPNSGNRIRELGSPLKERGGGFHLSGPRNGGLVLSEPKGLDEDEDGLGDFAGVDLARGFEKIGKYHTNERTETDGWA